MVPRERSWILLAKHNQANFVQLVSGDALDMNLSKLREIVKDREA